MLYFLIFVVVVLLALGFSHAVLVSHIAKLKAEVTAEIAKLKSKVR